MNGLTFFTDRLRVGPWADGDASWYLASIDEDIIRWTREPNDESEEAWLRRKEGVSADADRHWSRIDAHTGEPVGSLSSISAADTIELRYWIARPERGKGYATEVLAGAVDWLHGNDDTGRFRLEIHPDNVASRIVAERAGFVFEGFEASCDTCADEHGRVAVFVRTV